METAFINTTMASYLFNTIGILFTLYASAKIYNSLKLRRLPQRLLVEQINQLLPQTQCGQCGFEGCRPYARAISQGQAVNQCPPGGAETIVKLTTLLNDQLEPLNPAHGEFELFKVAVIREDECIGCTKCIRACPVDAILGGPKLMHTVIEAECTGCDLCVAPCPVDCIDMVPLFTSVKPSWSIPDSLSNLENSVGKEA